MTGAPTDRIHLDPGDWYVATWRNLPPLAPPAQAPFLLADCVERLGRRRASTGPWNWEQAGLSLAMGPEEARFWFEAMTQDPAAQKPRELALYLSRQDLSRPLTPRELNTRLLRYFRSVPSEVVLPLSRLTSPVEVARLIQDGSLTVKTRFSPPGMGQDELPRSLWAGFRKYLAPYLTLEEKEEIRAGLRPLLDPNAAASNTWALSLPFLLASCLGLHQEVLAFVSLWPDNGLRDGLNFARSLGAEFLVFGLGNPQLVLEQARRLGLVLRTADQARAWLASTELAGLDLLRDSVLAAGKKEEAEELAQVLALVKSPDATPHLLALRESKAAGEARRWLENERSCSLPGLVSLSASRGSAAEVSLELLRDFHRKGHTAEIEQALAAAPEQTAAKVRKLALESADPTFAPLEESEAPQWLRPPTTRGKGGKLPDWADPALLPPILLARRCLASGLVLRILAELRESSLEKPTSLVSLLRQSADRASLDAFAWNLFERWLGAGAPPKERWAMTALGLLGSDGCAVKLAPLVREWPGQNQHKRATHGLECLAAIGNETALLQLSGIADKVKFRGLQEKARLFMRAIADARGLTREQLEDRIVPSLDLDERGTRVFDFGPRQFRMVLGTDLKPMLRDEAGKVRAELPKPTSRDDPARASSAVTAWKLLKKQLREVLKLQAARLERALVGRRRWSARDFETFLVRHPLMTHLTRLLLWGCFDENGLTAAFRVLEGGVCADREDRPVTLPEGSVIGLIHPLHLPPEELRAWGEVLAEDEIMPPFTQLGRPVLTLEPGEYSQTILTRFDGRVVPPVKVLSFLERYGWTRSSYGGWPVTNEHYKSFPEIGLTAVLRYREGIPLHDRTLAGEQAIDGCFFARRLDRPEGGFTSSGACPLGSVDPVVLSETLVELTGLTATQP